MRASYTNPYVSHLDDDDRLAEKVSYRLTREDGSVTIITTRGARTVEYNGVRGEALNLKVGDKVEEPIDHRMRRVKLDWSPFDEGDDADD